MKNQIRNVLIATVGSAPRTRRRIDDQPVSRLIWLFVLISLPAVAIGVRLAQLQSVLGDGFVVETNTTSETIEPIPSLSGQILSADGRVLAKDVVEFSLKVHYRWLEQPADLDWIREQALSRLSRMDRRDADLVAREIEKVERAREELWKRIAMRTETPVSQLAENRTKVQHRIERILANVERRRRERFDAANKNAPRVSPANGGPLDASALWRRFVTALTTSPRRYDKSPVTIKEENDYHVMLEGISDEAAADIRAHPELFPGTSLGMTARRVYPLGSFAAHAVGSRTLISENALEELGRQFSDVNPLDYRPGDLAGTTGLERSYDRHLRGIRGLKRIVRNGQREIVNTSVTREPQPGRDVVLTLSVPLQQQVEAMLDEALGDTPRLLESSSDADLSLPKGGCIVALDVETGAVLAMASGPRYDANLLVDHDPVRWQAVIDDPRRPFVDRATTMTVAPGSVFKTLTAVALLEEGQVTPEQTVYCQGYLDVPTRHRCYHSHAHGEVDIVNAICRSCNVFFFTGAREMGPEPIYRWAAGFGFGRPTRVDLPGERSGNLPSPPSPDRPNDGKPWYRGDTLGLAIGQSRLAVTPLQVASMMATVANGGYVVTPHVVRDYGPTIVHDETNSGNDPALPISQTTQRPRLSISSSTLEIVRRGLERVVSHPRGTGYKRVRLKEITIAGKTGTAEVGAGRRDHAWFAGYVPTDQPRVAFAVVLEHGGTGGAVAGPVAKRLVQALLEQGIVGETQVTQRD